MPPKVNKIILIKTFGSFYDAARGFVLFILNKFVSNIPFHSLRLILYRLFFRVSGKCTILMNCTFRGFNIEIGSYSNINSGCLLDGRGAPLTIGRYVDIAPSVMIWTMDHVIESSKHDGRARPTVIKDYAWIGSGAIILPGVTVGYGSVVAAGSVVSRSVKDYEIVAGSPAKRIGVRKTRPTPRPLYRPWFE